MSVDTRSYKVWARSPWQKDATERSRHHHFPGAASAAERLARGSNDEGTVSVWVEDEYGNVVWSAGEKATELQAAKKGEQAK